MVILSSSEFFFEPKDPQSVSVLLFARKKEEVLLTCFNDDHEPAVALQKAVVELDPIGEVIHVVDHLSRRQLLGNFNLTLRIKAGIYTRPIMGSDSLTVDESGPLLPGDTVCFTVNSNNNYTRSSGGLNKSHTHTVRHRYSC